MPEVIGEQWCSIDDAPTMPITVRLRFVIGELCIRASRRRGRRRERDMYICISRARKMYRFISDTFTVRANRETRAKCMKLSGEIKGSRANFIRAFNADNARFRA